MNKIKKQYKTLEQDINKKKNINIKEDKKINCNIEEEIEEKYYNNDINYNSEENKFLMYCFYCNEEITIINMEKIKKFQCHDCNKILCNNCIKNYQNKRLCKKCYMN